MWSPTSPNSERNTAEPPIRSRRMGEIRVSISIGPNESSTATGAFRPRTVTEAAAPEIRTGAPSASTSRVPATTSTSTGARRAWIASAPSIPDAHAAPLRTVSETGPPRAPDLYGTVIGAGFHPGEGTIHPHPPFVGERGDPHPRREGRKQLERQFCGPRVFDPGPGTAGFRAQGARRGAVRQRPAWRPLRRQRPHTRFTSRNRPSIPAWPGASRPSVSGPRRPRRPAGIGLRSGFHPNIARRQGNQDLHTCLGRKRNGLFRDEGMQRKRSRSLFDETAHLRDPGFQPLALDGALGQREDGAARGRAARGGRPRRIPGGRDRSEAA